MGGNITNAAMEAREKYSYIKNAQGVRHSVVLPMSSMGFFYVCLQGPRLNSPC